MDSNMPADIDNRFSIGAFVNAALRLAVWFMLLVVGLMFVTPEMMNMFEEFGIELPGLTQFVIAMSDRMIKFWFVVLPGAAFMAMGAEAILFFLPQGSNRRILNWIYWLVVVVIVGFFLAAIVIPLITISVGLRG